MKLSFSQISQLTQTKIITMAAALGRKSDAEMPLCAAYFEIRHKGTTYPPPPAFLQPFIGALLHYQERLGDNFLRVTASDRVDL